MTAIPISPEAWEAYRSVFRSLKLVEKGGRA